MAHTVKEWGTEFIIVSGAGWAYRDQNPANLAKLPSVQDYMLFPDEQSAREFAARLDEELDREIRQESHDLVERARSDAQRHADGYESERRETEHKRALEASAENIKVLSKQLYAAEQDLLSAQNSLEIAKATVLGLETSVESAKARLDVVKSKLAAERQGIKQ
jgi:paraquat-inducible protein B